MAEREKAPSLRPLASLTSLAVAFVLIAVKFWAWLATGSVAMLTSALDALVDAVSALATFVGVDTHSSRQTGTIAGATARLKPLPR